MRLNGSNIERTRSYNRRVVLEAVRLQGPISRAEIAPQTVSNIAKELEETGLLQDAGRRPSKRGQPPRDLSMNPAGGYTVAFESMSLDFRVLLKTDRARVAPADGLRVAG